MSKLKKSKDRQRAQHKKRYGHQGGRKWFIHILNAWEKRARKQAEK